MDVTRMNQIAAMPRANRSAAMEKTKGAAVRLGPLPTLIVKMFKRGVKMGGSKGERRMRVVEQLTVGGKRQLSIVAIDGREYLIGGSAEGISVITPLPVEEQTMPVLQATARPAARAW